MKVVLKGQGRNKEVQKELMDIVNPSQFNGRINVAQDEILDLVVNYLQGSINIEELTYTINGWFIDDNLMVTELIALVQEKEKEWQELVKNPLVWFNDYVKELDPTTKKVIMIRPARHNELPDGRLDQNCGEGECEGEAQCNSSP